MRNCSLDTFFTDNLTVTMCPDFFAHKITLHSFNLFLSCRIDRKNNQYIRLVKRTSKLIKQGSGSCVSMGLKHYNFSSVRPAFLSSLKRYFNFSRMMAIIINYGNRIYFSLYFKSALNTFYCFQGIFNDFKIDIKLDSDSNTCH